ncbi:MAG: ATP-binding protein [Candidatus Omnitrophica bacterium]|nr:ATP-binding protein [Candidatus Omnitrophota bacterium]
MFNSGLKKKIAELNSALELFKERLNTLENENNRVHAILNSMVEGVIAVDKDTRVLSLNPTAEKIFNTTRDSALGRIFLEVFPNNDIAEVIALVLAKGEFISRELNLVWPVKKIFQVNASPISETGEINGCLLVIHDITEIRRLENMRRDFVANVSHELKTPLTSIKGFVETLLEGALDDKENSVNFLKIINNHADRLNTLINDLLDLSHIESKEIILKKDKFALPGLVDEVMLGFRSQAKKKGVEIKNEIPRALEIIADRSKIEQVFTNLINNAIKYNKEKGFARIYSEQLPGKIKIIVEDSGSGIPAKDIPRIFERFYRVDKARSRELGGTGLGLSIVKHIIELHSGSVGVESTEGLGSKFWFTLPQ